jgi:signal transduction histidine kinase
VFSREKVDLGRLAEAVAQRLGPQCGEKRQQIAVSVAGTAVVLASQLLEECLGQLLSNAMKYGPPDSTIEVAVSAGPRVRLTVRDRGAGVSPEGRERIFRRFESMEKGPIAGVGLGLAIAQRIVDLHGGRIWVDDHPDGGSVFVAEFPPAP